MQRPPSPPSPPSDWPRDDVDDSTTQHDTEARRRRRHHWPLAASPAPCLFSSSSSASADASSLLRCPAASVESFPAAAVHGRRCHACSSSSLAPAARVPCPSAASDGPAAARDERLQYHDDDQQVQNDYDDDDDSDDDVCLAATAAAVAAAAPTRALPSSLPFLSSLSTDEPALYQHYYHRSIQSRLDLDMSDSDGGAPLDDGAAAALPFPPVEPVGHARNDDSSPSDAPDWDTTTDDDDGHDDDDGYDQDDDNDPPSASHHSPQQPDTNSPTLFSLALHTPQDVAALIMDEAFPAPPWPNGPQPVPLLPGNGPPQDAFPALMLQPPFFAEFVDTLPPLQPSNPNPAILGSENLGLVDFLRDWAQRGCFSPMSRPRPPFLQQLLEPPAATASSVTYADLRGNDCDFQALDWTSMWTTRHDARIRRRHTYKNYVNRPGSDVCRPRDRRIPSTDSFFRFSKMTFRSDVSLAHFQLRSVLACPSRTQAYYSSSGGITRMNLASKKTDLVLNLREFPDMGGVISTLDAAHGILMGGTFNGDYCIQSLDSDEPEGFSEGQISPDAITNHLKIHTPRRSARPVASIASNDRGFRVLDIETEKLISQTRYDFALNCSASSPDQRLRVLVGDHPVAIVVNADTGETLQELTGHYDYGFACDWSDDGWTVATGFQDKAVKIWDARRWCNSSGVSSPLCTIRSEMAGVRGLHFSPLGSGRPMLAAAEEADFVNLIDAQTFATKQTIDVFSEIGGLAFANDGQDLNVLCCDAHRGGLLQLERCGSGPEPVPSHAWRCSRPWLAGGGQDDLWPDHWSRNRRPTLLEGPAPF